MKTLGLTPESFRTFTRIMKWLSITIALALFAVYYANAQDTIPMYDVKISTYTFKNNGHRITMKYYHAVGTDDGQDVKINTAGGGGVTYNWKDTDSACIYYAKCGHDQIQCNYQLHSITDVLFNTEQCLIENSKDIRAGINYVALHPEKFGNPNTGNIILEGRSWGAGVVNYLAYTSVDIDMVVSMWGFVLDVNDITNVPTLLIHGTDDKTIPYDKGYCYNIVYVYGSNAIYDYMNAKNYPVVFLTKIGAGHGLKQGDKTTANKLYAQNASLKFSYDTTTSH